MTREIIELVQFDVDKALKLPWDDLLAEVFAGTRVFIQFEAKFKVIDSLEKPLKGHAWLREGMEGMPELYKSNWDDSD